MPDVIFQYELSKRSLSEELADLDFDWPISANCCFQLFDGEVVFLKSQASAFNKLRHMKHSAGNHCPLSFVTGTNFVYSDFLIILDVIATDWNVAITKIQIFISLLTSLSNNVKYDEALVLILEKARALKINYKRSDTGVLFSIDTVTTLLVPYTSHSINFVFNKHVFGTPANE